MALLSQFQPQQWTVKLNWTVKLVGALAALLAAAFLAAALLAAALWAAAAQIEGAPPKIDEPSMARQAPRTARQAARTALQFDSRGGILLAGSQMGVEGLTRDQIVDFVIPTELEQVLSIQFSPDQTKLAIAGGRPAIKGTVEIWSWPQRERLAKLEGHTDTVNDVQWLAGGDQLATASADHVLKIWDVASSSARRTLRGHSGPVLAVAISPDQRWLCSASADHTIRVWRTADWTLRRTLNNHLDIVHDLEFKQQREPTGHMSLASSSDDGTVRIWYPEIGRMVRIIRNDHPVLCLAYRHDGVCFGSTDGCVRINRQGVETEVVYRSETPAWVVSMTAAPAQQDPHAVARAHETHRVSIVAGLSDGRIEWLDE